MFQTFEKFIVHQVPDDRCHCFQIHNKFTDGTTTNTGFAYKTYDEAEREVEKRNR
jgi:hypothetical protein